MIGDFFESFGREEDEIQKLPKEILDILNSNLPDNFVYALDETGHYKASLSPEKVSESIKIKTQLDFDKEKDVDTLEKLNRIPYDKWYEYFYRTQMRVPIKNAKIGDANKVIPVEELTRDPLSDDTVSFEDGFIQAYDFPDPIKILFESPEGDSIEIGIQQQAYDSLVEIKYHNVDFPALKIEFYQFKPLVDDYVDEAHTSVSNQIMVYFSVTPSKADSVKDAVTALHIFRGLLNGTTRVNGHPISTPQKTDDTYYTKKIEDYLDFWETTLKLEEKLHVRFNPKADCPEKDVRFLTELQTCILDEKAIIWRHPFDHFYIGDLQLGKEGFTIEDVFDKGSTVYRFLEGPIPATLLGAEFNLYSHTEMKDFIITNIEWNDETKRGVEVYISDVPDKQWTLTRFYISESDMENLRINSMYIPVG